MGHSCYRDHHGHRDGNVTESELADEQLLTLDETAALLRVGRHTLEGFIAQSWGPPAIDLTPPGRRKRLLRFDRRQVARWIELQSLWKACA
jgi:hypothetical protein